MFRQLKPACNCLQFSSGCDVEMPCVLLLQTHSGMDMVCEFSLKIKSKLKSLFCFQSVSAHPVIPVSCGWCPRSNYFCLTHLNATFCHSLALEMSNDTTMLRQQLTGKIQKFQSVPWHFNMHSKHCYWVIVVNIFLNQVAFCGKWHFHKVRVHPKA